MAETTRHGASGLWFGGAVLGLLLLAALAAPWIAERPGGTDLDRILEPPSAAHPLGTDDLGRDLGLRVWFGSRVSLAVGLLAALVAVVVGVPLGAAAGYLEGRVDAVVSRLIEAVLCFPPLLLLLALLTVAPAWMQRLPDAAKIALVLGGLGWVPVARYLRGEFLRVKQSDAITAARALGASGWRLSLRHILPAALTPVLVTTAFAVGRAVVAEAALSFIGLGVRPPTPTWGGLLNEARHHIDRAWWLALFPGLALFVVVLACNLLGEGLRDRLDPRSRRRA